MGGARQTKTTLIHRTGQSATLYLTNTIPDIILHSNIFSHTLQYYALQYYTLQNYVLNYTIPDLTLNYTLLCVYPFFHEGGINPFWG